MSIKHFSLVACALAALSTAAGAQFTAAVVPPKAKAKVDTTARQDSVRRATVALAARVTDMKRWVDSAAGVSLPPAADGAKDSTKDSTKKDSTKDSVSARAARTPATKDSVILSRNARVRADSAASIRTVEVHDSTGLKGDSAAATVPPTSARPSNRQTTRFAKGAAAPATATMLPLLALAATATLLAGAALTRS